jgi:hypothetical protein
MATTYKPLVPSYTQKDKFLKPTAPAQPEMKPYEQIVPKTAPQTDPLPQFDNQREMVNRRLNQATQQGTDALKRKLAAIGNLNSGAAIKQEQNLLNDVNTQREEAMANVDAQEIAERARLNEAQTGRDFAANESALNRKLQQEIFSEQKRQNEFTEKLSLDEHELSKFNTMYNTALSAATSDAKRSVERAFEDMFGANMKFPGMEGGEGGAPGAQPFNRTADANGAVGWHPSSILRDPRRDMFSPSTRTGGLNSSAALERRFIGEALKKGYTREDALEALKKGYKI